MKIVLAGKVEGSDQSLSNQHNQKPPNEAFMSSHYSHVYLIKGEVAPIKVELVN
jgi:hypothetical protein